MLGRGRTGSGKTIAFALPLLARLADGGRRAGPSSPRALILAPTRELATQIDAAIAPLAAALGLRTVTVFGGVGAGPQIARRCASGVDIVVACPGRLDDHVAAGHAASTRVEITVLDEADHMADLGFLPVVTPPARPDARATASGCCSPPRWTRGVDVLVKRVPAPTRSRTASTRRSRRSPR